MTQSKLPTPPVARKEPTATKIHSVTLTDDYAWLRDKQNTEVTAYLDARRPARATLRRNALARKAD
jgi:oligopeptidase B